MDWYDKEFWDWTSTQRTVRLKRAQFEREGPGWVGGINEQICEGESLSLSSM